MEKYIDADLLRKEIEFAKSVYDNPKRIVVGIADAFRQDGRAAMCDDILKKIDSLQQEQPEANDLDFEQELYNRFGQIKDFTLGMRIGQYFYELGCRRTAEKYDEIEYNRQRAEKPIPNDLEEAAEKKYPVYWKNYPKDGIVRSESSYDTNKQCRDAFIAGAKWQAEQLLKSSPLPEDTVLFNKGVKEGKRLMMEEVVEGEYDQYPAAIYLPTPIPKMNKGDKVKIIIVKEDEK